MWKVLELDREGAKSSSSPTPAESISGARSIRGTSVRSSGTCGERAQACKDPAEIRVTWSERNSTEAGAADRLRNNGPPVTPDERARVFEAFYTTKTHGTGLGMTIAKRIVERTAAGSGWAGPAAEFVVTLPRGGA